MWTLPRKYERNGEMFSVAVASGYVASDNCWQVGSGLDWLSCCRDHVNAADILMCHRRHWRSSTARSRHWVRRKTKLPSGEAHASRCLQQQNLCWRHRRAHPSYDATLTCQQPHWRNYRNCRREASCVSAKSKPKTAEKPHSSCYCSWCSWLFCTFLNRFFFSLTGFFHMFIWPWPRNAPVALFNQRME